MSAPQFTPERVCMRCERDGATVCSCPAKELYYARRRLVEEVADDTTSEEQLRDVGYPATYAKAVTIARSALAKARGEA